MVLGLFEAGQKIDYRFNKVNKCLFVFVIEGSLLISSQELGKRDAVGIWDTAFDHRIG